MRSSLLAALALLLFAGACGTAAPEALPEIRYYSIADT